MSTTTTTTTNGTEAGPTKLSVAHDVDHHKGYPYTAYLPVYDTETCLPPLQPFEHNDRGLVADKQHRNLLSKEKNPNLTATKLTAVIRTDIRGLQLSQLDDRQKDDLALLLAERSVVVFHDQDFKDIGPDKQKDIARYFGPLHIHAVRSHAKDNLEILNIYLGPDNPDRWQVRKGHLTSIAFHSDMTYERQPPGLTMFTLLSVPPTGGDTVWTSQAAAYARLSQPIKTLLEGLRAEHSGHPQADGARRRGKLCTEGACYFAASCYSGPLGRKSLFVNAGFTQRIVRLKHKESEALLKLLYSIRVKWEEGTVCLWDDRVTCHTAISDYSIENPQEGLRHGIRLTVQAERPVGVNGLESAF